MSTDLRELVRRAARAAGPKIVLAGVLGQKGDMSEGRGDGRQTFHEVECCS